MRRIILLERFVNTRWTSNSPKSAEEECGFSDDPVSMLRDIQSKMKSHQKGSEEPPIPKRISGKTMFFKEKEKQRTENPFMQKVIAMESDSHSSSFPTYSASREERQKKKSKEILTERSKLLVFRDVGMDLDKPILSRDVFLIWKYFKLGRQFAIDNELERMLRYFNEHAVNELKIIHNSKLMRGPEKLYKVDATKRNLSSLDKKEYSLKFPPVKCANVAQFCPNPSSSLCDEFSRSLYRSTSFFKRFSERRSRDAEEARHFSHTNESLFTVIGSACFSRPAVVIYSQLGQKFGAEADSAWRKLAYSTICPRINADCDNRTNSIAQNPMPIDVVSLRSSDLYHYKWVQKLYISRFVSSLSKDENLQSHTIASTTFVGSKLLQPFFDPLGLRNYLSPYVFLVDGKGNIRWMSSGLPDSWEENLFPGLLKQLQQESHENN